MADGRRYALSPQLDIAQIQKEAKIRWLRPSEICEILRNYQRFHLTPDPPCRPPGGSLFLFDRKALRYFRKDGHNWRKKKDGKTVREAHEKLKAGSVDVLHCYYAHGEDNENFQRRSYWMLDGELEHIVLVHYRDVNEGSRSSNSHLSNIDSTRVHSTQGTLPNSALHSTHLNLSSFTTQASYASSSSATDRNGQTPSSEFEDADSGEAFGGGSLTDSVSCSGFQIASLAGNDMTEESTVGGSGSSHLYPRSFVNAVGSSIDPLFMNQVPLQSLLISENQQKIHGASKGAGPLGGVYLNNHSGSAGWPDLLGISRKNDDMLEQKISFEHRNCPDNLQSRMADSMSNDQSIANYVTDGRYNVLPSVLPQIFIGVGKRNEQVEEGNAEKVNSFDDKRMPLEYETEVSNASKKPLESNAHNDEHGDLKKLDSFGRWMNKEIGKDCDDSLMASDSCNYWNALDAQNDDKEVSSLSHHMQLDIDPLGPSLSQEQLFSIVDFSPDWANSGVETKVLISGTYLGSVEPRSVKWGCMFGELEVSAEVLTTNVLRCQAPAHTPGRVPFYITRSDRLACSEVREFEYRKNLSGLSLVSKSEPEDEVYLQVRFAKMLSLGIDRKWLFCSVENCSKCSLRQNYFSMLNEEENEWKKIEEDSKSFQEVHKNPRDALIQKLLKGKLYEWLVCKAHEEGKGPNILDEEGQGAIHLAAALGYDWAMAPIVTAGVSPSFRDQRGRTGLHWAAYYGREETVVALIGLGAAPGAVEDPTSKFPQGQTAADLASSRGHKGIAGYLAEADLTSHLSSLTLKENVMDGVSVTLAAQKAIETLQDQNIDSLDGDKGEQLSLRGSLAAVRNSAQAAARIQATFRVYSFRQRQLRENKDEEAGSLDDMMVLSSLNNKFHRISHFNEALHTAAVKIQQKYRGWKGRKEFLKIRDRIVKIQAHVRGHQVRKQYKKVVWSVSIVEKAILRWRRKGAGLRGFRAENASSAVEQVAGKTDEYDFLRLGRKQKVASVEKALARVQSMARHPEARDQYMRLVACSRKSKLGDEGSSSAQVQNSEEEKKAGEDLLAPLR